MPRIVTILTEGFADWETTLLNAVAKGFYRAETAYASPGGKPVTSMGGMRVTPDMAIEAIDPAALDALVVCGGSAWKQVGAPDITAVVQAARQAGKTVAGICDGTVALARTGVLDAVPHTSNGVGYLDDTGYRGKAGYRDVPAAVSADGVITASATAPVSFAEKILDALGLADDQLRYYVAMHARQYAGMPQVRAA
jgi:putative intracellular protease/amidase